MRNFSVQFSGWHSSMMDVVHRGQWLCFIERIKKHPHGNTMFTPYSLVLEGPKQGKVYAGIQQKRIAEKKAFLIGAQYLQHREHLHFCRPFPYTRIRSDDLIYGTIGQVGYWLVKDLSGFSARLTVENACIGLSEKGNLVNSLGYRRSIVSNDFLDKSHVYKFVRGVEYPLSTTYKRLHDNWLYFSHNGIVARVHDDNTKIGSVLTHIRDTGIVDDVDLNTAGNLFAVALHSHVHEEQCVQVYEHDYERGAHKLLHTFSIPAYRVAFAPDGLTLACFIQRPTRSEVVIVDME